VAQKVAVFRRTLHIFNRITTVGCRFPIEEILVLKISILPLNSSLKFGRQKFLERKKFFLQHSTTDGMDGMLQGQLGWRESTDMCAACYLVSFSVAPPHSRSVWFARATEDERQVYMEWIKSANFRASHTGMCRCEKSFMWGYFNGSRYGSFYPFAILYGFLT